MDWAAQNAIDTAKLKAAKSPAYGKWHYPEIPAGEPLGKLKTGQIPALRPAQRASEGPHGPRAPLRRARGAGDHRAARARLSPRRRRRLDEADLSRDASARPERGAGCGAWSCSVGVTLAGRNPAGGALPGWASCWPFRRAWPAGRNRP